ncbi:MAG: DUF4143 domain-containing protein [Bifidobacteriaceae bacterium]|nr:DUF4143 domain-containing protein [Bifidobacteriaceae bacterium]
MRRRAIGRSKALTAGTGLAAHITDQPGAAGGRARRRPFGRGIESLALSKLIKQRGWSEQRWDVAHYLDREGLEVDGVIELADGLALAAGWRVCAGSCCVRGAL